MSSTTTTATTQTISLQNHISGNVKAEDAKSQTCRVQPQGLAATATGGYEVPGIPKFDDLYKKRQWQLEHMAGAFRVFARKGFTEGTAGHISVRDPVDPNTFWINPSVHAHVLSGRIRLTSS